MHKRIDPTSYGLHAGKESSLQGTYEEFFAPLVGKEITLFELGVLEGASLHFWCDYFETATIVGLDSIPVHIDDPTGMIHVYQGHQEDTELLDRIARIHAPNGFDIIIDDCSHIGRFARVSFWHLFQNHLKPGGIYSIEDWGTGYMAWWPDGRRYKPGCQLAYSRISRLVDGLLSGYSPRLAHLLNRMLRRSAMPSHMYGMVGFVKELLDACCLGEIASPRSGSGRYRDYWISRLHVSPGVVIAWKALQSR